MAKNQLELLSELLPVLPKTVFNDDTRLLQQLPGGTLVKQCGAVEDEAKQEAQALVAARLLLDSRLRVPACFGHLDQWIVIEEILSDKLEPENADQVCKAAEYLGCMHSTKLDDAVRMVLANNGHQHYYSGSLENRLREEVRHSEVAQDAHGESWNLPVLEEAVTKVIPRLSQCGDPVLGHGDFQKKNILIAEDGSVVPVDWRDFGICNRWYELAHFLRSVDPVTHEKALEIYSDRVGIDISEEDDSLRIGKIIDAIIRAGSKARTFDPAPERAASSRSRFIEHAERAAELVRAFSG